jgi:hypothetical protein
MTIRIMLRKACGDYRRIARSELTRLCSRVVLEGVDGDEDANSVTYWYRRSETGVKPEKSAAAA